MGEAGEKAEQSVIAHQWEKSEVCEKYEKDEREDG